MPNARANFLLSIKPQLPDYLLSACTTMSAIEKVCGCRPALKMSVHQVQTGSDRLTSQSDAIDRAPRGRELSVREGLTWINVDWSGSWQAARLGNWLR